MTSSEIRYLTAIYEMSSENAMIKQSDLAKKMKLSRVSVQRAIEKLYCKKLVSKDDKAQFALTEKGVLSATNYMRCRLYIERLLMQALGSRPQNARIESIAILGVMSDRNVENLYRTMEKKGDELICR